MNSLQWPTNWSDIFSCWLVSFFVSVLNQMKPDILCSVTTIFSFSPFNSIRFGVDLYRHVCLVAVDVCMNYVIWTRIRHLVRRSWWTRERELLFLNWGFFLHPLEQIHHIRWYRNFFNTLLHRLCCFQLKLNPWIVFSYLLTLISFFPLTIFFVKYFSIYFVFLLVCFSLLFITALFHFSLVRINPALPYGNTQFTKWVFVWSSYYCWLE